MVLKYCHPVKRDKKMSKQKIPKRISNVLAEGEIIEKMFDLKGRIVCVTDKRLIELNGRTIRDFDYTHISSIKYSSRRHWGLFALGIMVFLSGVLIAKASGEATWSVLSGIGFFLMLLSAILKPEWVEVSVFGMPHRIKWPGSKDKLDALLQIVRKMRTTKREV
jgi:hypothetical protein